MERRIKIFWRTIDDYMMTGAAGTVIIENLEFLKSVAGNNHVYSDLGNPDVYFYNKDKSDYFGKCNCYFDGMAVFRWLRETLDYHDSYIDFLRAYSTIDEEAAEKHMIDNHKSFKYCYPFVLNKNVQKILVDYCDEKIAEIKEIRRQIEEKEEARKRAEQEERDRLMKGADWSVTEKTITDEGGKTKEYLHTIIINGNTYKFTERNLFDVGRVINPYPQGGLIKFVDGCYYTEKFDAVGWTTDRKLTDDEARAYQIVSKYGEYKRARIRM